MKSLLVLTALIAVLLIPASVEAQERAEPDPGTAPQVAPFAAARALPPAPVAPIVVESGRISLSVDGLGTLASNGTISVEKPAGGTVRGAYLVAASRGFSGFEPADGDIRVLGQPVDFDDNRTMINGISSVNVWADITENVKPFLDAAPAGTVALPVAEGALSALIDGTIVAVIFDDPTATTDRSVILAYGAQQVTGDSIRLVRLPDTPLEDVTASLGVGISFGFQPTNQDSAINVNGTRLSTSAGGQDDGISSDGALITVGGIGDSVANPVDPFARGSAAGCPRCDDELYDLSSFVTADGVSELSLTTTNPSADDNFMFAALDVRGATATWQSSADPCAGVDIVICYAPEVRFHPGENYFPWDPDLFIFGSELTFSQTGACYQETVLTETMTPVDIALERYFGATVSLGLPSIDFDLWPPGADVDVCYADEDRLYGLKEFTRPFDADSASIDPASNRPNDLGLRNGFYINFVDGDQAIRGYTPLANNRLVAPMYVQILPDERGSGRQVISYLMFYGYDPKAEASLGVDLNDIVSVGDGIIAHQGDWERVDVVLGDNNVPDEVRWFGHGCNGPTFDESHIKTWAELQAGLPNGGGLVDGTHPIVYSAQGSHASYPTEHEAGPQVCPEADGGQLKGTTDAAEYVPGQSAVWRPWENGGSSIVDPRGECWYSFGGSWGDTGGRLQTVVSFISRDLTDRFGIPEFNALKDATGPAGPYHNLVNGQPVAVPDKCRGAILAISFTPDVITTWGASGAVTLEQAPPNSRYVLTFASVEKLVGEGTADASGNLTLDYTVPTGIMPGRHLLVVRDAATGQRVGAKMVSVTVPSECLVTPNNTTDIDGDSVLDVCDPDPTDGPIADLDMDGVINFDDNCPHVYNPDQSRNFERSSGAACDPREGFNLVSVLDNPCSGLVATIVGTDGDDVIRGTNGPDIIDGMGGNDVIDGRNGDDIICVTSGENIIDGGNGADRIFGGSGIDQIAGGNAIDYIVGGSGADQLDGGRGTDALFGGAGADILVGGNGDDWLGGEGGDDTLDGGRGDDNIVGGTGVDSANGGRGDDICIAETSTDCEA